MTTRAATRLAPSSRLALYLAAVIGVYMLRDPMATIALSAVCCVASLVWVRLAQARIPSIRWRAVLVFAGWVFAMKVALDLVGGGSIHDAETVPLALRQAARVSLLMIGVLSLIALTPARAIVEEIETTRLPRSARLLVMMLVQYPRVLRDRYDQIVEAQIARGADRPRSVLERVTYGSRVLLPVLQSELNAIGERAGLIHLRGLDVDVAIPEDVRHRSMHDIAALTVAAVAIVGAIGFRIVTR